MLQICTKIIQPNACQQLVDNNINNYIVVIWYVNTL